jgi:hypothetical protein
MLSRRSRTARIVLAVAAPALLAAACRHRADPPADEAALADRLRAAGFVVHVEEADVNYRDASGRMRRRLSGVYFAREEQDWDDVVARMRGDRHTWRGVAVATRGSAHNARPPDAPQYMVVGGWVFYGDPRLLAEVADRLAP